MAEAILSPSDGTSTLILLTFWCCREAIYEIIDGRIRRHLGTMLECQKFLALLIAILQQKGHITGLKDVRKYITARLNA